MLRKLLLSVFTVITLFQFSNAQCDSIGEMSCAICEVRSSITMISGGTAIVDSSFVEGVKLPTDDIMGTPYVVRTEGCGALSLSIDLMFDWAVGPNVVWLHGVSFMASDGWQVSTGVPPSEGWFFLDSITGCCSNNTYGAGYYYDDPDNSDNSGCGTCTEDVEGNPADNWGVNPDNCCPVFGYNLVYCPSVAMDTVIEQITFSLTEDGESGNWAQGSGCNYEITFPIMIINQGFADFPSQVGPICPGEEVTLSTVDDCDSYLWSTGDTTTTITVAPDMTTTYTVVMSNASGCEITRSTEVLVEQGCSVALQPMYGPICPGDCIELSVNSACTDLAWSTGDMGTTSIVVCPTSTTNYTVSTSEICGASGPTEFTTQVVVRDANDPECEEIAVPTLGEWGAISLGLLFMVIGVVAMRRERRLAYEKKRV